jgi:hypothetical protein
MDKIDTLGIQKILHKISLLQLKEMKKLERDKNKFMEEYMYLQPKIEDYLYLQTGIELDEYYASILHLKLDEDKEY